MSDDEELQRAISLSIAENTTYPHQQNVDEDEEARFNRDLQAAIAASKVEAEARKDSRSSSPSTEPSKSDSEPVEASTSSITKASSHSPEAPLVPTPEPQLSGFMKERAQLEKARLERQKRLHSQTGPQPAEDDGTPPAKKQRTSQPQSRMVTGNTSLSVSTGNARPSTSQRSQHAYESSTPLYWEGELRQTANMHADPKKDVKPVFRLSEIVSEKKNIEFAIVSSYSLQVSWIYDFFDPHTPVVLIAQPDEEGHSSIKNILPNWIKTTPFLRNGRGCMHVKLLMLFYKSGRLRIAIPTANFIDYDWRDIENTVWVQDFPKRPTPIKHEPRATDFPAMLQRVLQSLNVQAALISHQRTDHPNLPIHSVTDIRCVWDFSKAGQKQHRVQLVASLAGKHEGWEAINRTGHTALVHALRSAGARTGDNKEVILECQGSSIGTYSTQWMNEFHSSAKAQSARTWLDTEKSKRTKQPWPPVKIIFPSYETVKNSRLGFPGGGTMFCRKSQWYSSKFPKEAFRDSNSKRGGILMHSKMIIATFRDRPSPGSSSKASSSKGKQKRRIPSHDYDSDNDLGSEKSDDDIEEVDESQVGIDPSVVGWAYVGSHNFTPSAWGTLSGSSARPVLNITNYEMGIVFPLKSDKEIDDIACWERPPRKYDLKTDRPWMQEEVLGP